MADAPGNASPTETAATPVDDSIRAAALAAMQDQGLTAENWPVEGTEENSETPPETVPATPPAGDETVEKTPETPASEVTPEPSAAEETPPPGDVPTEYFGVDLNEVPPEKRAEIINRFKEQDRYVQSVQQRAAELEKQAQPQAQPAPQPEPEAAPSDDDIMAALGVSSDDEMYDLKKELLLPQAKALAEIKATQDAFIQEQRVREFENHWNSTLDQLEETHGKLPITRDELAAIAVANDIFDPMDAYARVHLTGRQTLNAEVEKFKAEAKKAAEEAAKPKPPSTQSPRPTDATPVAKPELLSPKDAARKAAEKLGFDWAETLNSMSS